MRNTRSFKLRLLAMLGVAVFFLGCKDEEGILGLNVQPGSDQPGILSTDTIQLISYSQIEDSLRSDEAFSVLIGAYNDPVFGVTRAGFYSQFLPTNSNIDFGTNAVLDSIVLMLEYDGIYADSHAVQTVVVRELLDDIEKSEEYYTNFSANLGTEDLASQATTLLVTDSVQVDTITYKPHLRIRLDQAFGQSIFDQIDETTTSETFLEILKGLYVSVNDSNLSSGSGSIGKYNLGRGNNISGLSLYYHNDEKDTSFYTLKANQGNTAYINVFDHQYNNAADIQNILNDSTLGQSEFYVQGLSGLRGHIEIPHLPNYQDSGIAVNQALLYLPISNGSNNQFDAPNGLSLALLDTAGSKINVVDFLIDPTRFDGKISDDKTHYVFNITRHVNAVIKGDIPNYPLLVLASGGLINPNRLILAGHNDLNNNLRLHITYIKP